MLAIITSEFRKLITLRSTYVLLALAVALVTLFSFYFEGFKGNTGSPASMLRDDALTHIISNSIGMAILFISIIAILNVAHEYRHNSILYTLTANVRRTKVLFSKIFTLVGFGVVSGLLITAIGVAGYMLGVSMRGADLPAQDIQIWAEIGRLIFYNAGYILLSVFIALITRSVVFGIVVLFMFPSTIEPLLSMVLKENAKYLPFASLDSTMGASLLAETLSSGRAMIVSSAYLAVGLFLSWLLFVRRDAN